MAFTGNYTCNVFRTGLMNGTFNFTSGTFKIALYTNAATLDATTTAYTATGEVTDAGYTAGGETLTITQTPTKTSTTTFTVQFPAATDTSAIIRIA